MRSCFEIEISLIQLKLREATKMRRAEAMRSGVGGGTRARAVTRNSFLRTREARAAAPRVPESGSRGRSQGGNGPPGRRKKGLDVYEAELGDFQMVSNLLVEAFYTDTKDEENNLSAMQRRGLERDQNLDLRARYGRATKEGKGLIRSAILVAGEVDGEGSERDLGCVALGTTPFVGDQAQLSIRDLYSYSNRAGSNQQDDVELRPVVANLAVRPEARRRGIAKKLMSRCERVCAEWGYQEIWLLVEKDNPKARRLYRKLGYKERREEEDDSYKLVEGKLRQVDVTNVYMRKSLRPFPVRQVENADWPRVAVVAVALALSANPEVREAFLALLTRAGIDTSIVEDLVSRFL